MLQYADIGTGNDYELCCRESARLASKLLRLRMSCAARFFDWKSVVPVLGPLPKIVWRIRFNHVVVTSTIISAVMAPNYTIPSTIHIITRTNAAFISSGTYHVLFILDENRVTIKRSTHSLQWMFHLATLTQAELIPHIVIISPSFHTSTNPKKASTFTFHHALCRYHYKPNGCFHGCIRWGGQTRC